MVESIIHKWGLLRTFALFSFVSIISISIVSGMMFFSFIQKNLLQRELVISSEFIQSVSLINDPEAYFQGSTEPEARLAIEEFFQHITSIPDVFRVTIYNANYQIIWSNEKNLIGRTFTDNDELAQAYTGENTFKKVVTNDYAKQEHSFLPDDVEQFVEGYIPVWDKKHQNVIGAIELYKSPTALFKTIQKGRLLVIGVTLFGAFMLYGLLFWIVRRAHQLIKSQRERIKQASSRAVELNEHNLRRIGSELHDGPAQSIGFALLKLDSILEAKKDLNTAQILQPNIDLVDKIQAALSDSLQEIRNLSSGLVIPDLGELSAKDAVLKVIERHEKRTSTQVKHSIKNIPDTLSTSSKICIYRFVQEGLNNAFQHGKGIDQAVNVLIKGENLVVTVSDAGPGMNDVDIITINDTEHLGLRGLRERVESLGGVFSIISNKRDTGVTLIASLPIYS